MLKDPDMNKVLWFVGGAVLGYVLKEAVEEWLEEQDEGWKPVGKEDGPITEDSEAKC